MRNDDSGPLLRFNCDCMRLSCSRDFSTEPRKRSTSLRTCSGRSFKLNETKSGSKLRRALPMAAPTEATTPCMIRSESFISSGEILADALQGLILVHTVGANTDFRAETGRQQENAQDAARVRLHGIVGIGAVQNDIGLKVRRKLHQFRSRARVQAKAMANHDLAF